MLANGAQIQLQVLYSDTRLVQVALQKDMKSALKPLKNAKNFPPAAGFCLRRRLRRASEFSDYTVSGGP